MKLDFNNQNRKTTKYSIQLEIQYNYNTIYCIDQQYENK